MTAAISPSLSAKSRLEPSHLDGWYLFRGLLRDRRELRRLDLRTSRALLEGLR